jgi:hypothetical protein
MQPRSLQQVLSELDSVYNPQIDSIRQRQAAIPGQLQAEEQGLQAKQETAFGDILNGARRRGMGFSGIPLGEQARYTADNYMPALARLKQSGREQAMSLEDAILGINERRQQQGQGIYQFEQQAAEQRRQFDEQMRAQREQAAQSRAAAAANTFAPSVGMMGGGRQPAAVPKATLGQYGFKNGKDGAGGFYFTDGNGQPVSAATYARINSIPFAQLISRMAAAGDGGARAALSGPGVNSTASSYKALSWG